MYKGIIFDMDGVLVNTNELHFKAWKKVSKELKIDNYTYQDYCNNEMGAGRKKSIERLAKINNIQLSMIDIEYLEQLKSNTFIKYFDDLLETDSKKLLFDNVENVLKILKNKNIKIALGSSSKNAKLIIKKLGLIKYFDYICCHDEKIKAKPEPDIFLNCKIGLGLEDKELLIVEDSINGILASKNANIDCCQFGKNASSKIPKYHISNMIELLDIV